MSAALGDLLRFTDRQTILGQTALNVYFYRVTSITGLTGTYLDDLGEWFRDNVVDVVASMQSSDLDHTDVYIENLSNGIDIATFVDGFPISGDASGDDNMPPYVSAGFQLIRESRATRNGYKRIAGMVEGNITDGVYTASMTPITNVETALAADIQLGIVTVAEPVIVQHPIEVPVGSYVYASIGSALFKGIGTQNTRKFGRGI